MTTEKRTEITEYMLASGLDVNSFKNAIEFERCALAIYMYHHVKDPVVKEVFADNGEHSHWELLNQDGEVIWSGEAGSGMAEYWGEQWVLMAERKRELEQEVERLKQLAKDQYFQRFRFKKRIIVHTEWEKFKTENNL